MSMMLWLAYGQQWTEKGQFWEIRRDRWNQPWILESLLFGLLLILGVSTCQPAIKKSLRRTLKKAGKCFISWALVLFLGEKKSDSDDGLEQLCKNQEKKKPEIQKRKKWKNLTNRDAHGMFDLSSPSISLGRRHRWTVCTNRFRQTRQTVVFCCLVRDLMIPELLWDFIWLKVELVKKAIILTTWMEGGLKLFQFVSERGRAEYTSPKGFLGLKMS